MMNLDRVVVRLSALGMGIERGTDEAGTPTVTATMETGRGLLTVLCLAQGARIGKPNGTSKYLYRCSDNKLSAVVAQTIKANK